MKKLYFYLVSMLVAAFVAVGCTEDITKDEVFEGPTGEVVKEMMTVTATLECEEPAEGEESRTTLIDNNGGKVAWSEGDTIGAVSADGTIKECAAQSVNGSSATFEVPSDTMYAVYPYASGSTFDTAQKTMNYTLPNTRNVDGTNKVFGDKENVMCAHLSNKTLSFRNLCGYIEIKLKGTGTVKHVALRNNTKTWDALSGLGTIDFSDAQEPKFTSGTDHGKTLNFAYAKCSEVTLSTSEATSFYFIVPPRTYENLAICVQTDKGSYSVLSKNAITVNRSKIRPIAAINIDNVKSTSTTDLSADGVANCYVVPQGGASKYYSFPARKINGEANLENAAYAHLMWSEGEQLVSNICYDATSGKVSFKYEGNNAEGNALVGVFDASNVLLWAWHIWCTDQPEMIVVQKTGATQKYGILDRNVGATYTPSTTAEAAAISEADATASVGLYYQYGRPTPFPRGTSIKNSTTEGTAFKIHSDFAVQYAFRAYAQNFSASTQNNSYVNALRYPNLFLAVSYTDTTGATVSSTRTSYHTWYGTPYNAFSQGDYLWYSTRTDVVGKKADNDPCPAGYVVDDGIAGTGYLTPNVYTKATYSSSYSYGYYWKCPAAGGLVWLPASGFRNEYGRLGYLGQNFNLWMVPTYADNGQLTVYRFTGLNADSKPTYQNYQRQAYAFNIRCRIMDRTALQSATSTTTFEGQGTAASPYLIKTAEDLVKLSNLCSGKAVASGVSEFKNAHYALAANINMSGKAFSPIAPFSGSFDGKNYTISNLTVTPNSDNTPTGMFGEIMGATIKNVKFTNASVLVTSTSQLCTGGLVGVAANSTIDNITFDGKVSSAANVQYVGTLETRNASAVVGGVVGESVNTAMSNITFSGEVGSTAGQYVGGIAAVVDGGSVTNAKFAKGANLYTTMNHVGGIAGMIGNDAVISKCTVEAPVMSKYAYLGGIVGRMQSGTVSECLVTSDAIVAADKGNATNNGYYGTGGIVGKLETVAGKGTTVVIEKCACYTDVSGNIYVGGIVGDFIGNNPVVNARISDCVFKGNISVAYKNSYNYGLSGGIIGCCHQSNSKGGQTKVTDCVALIDQFKFSTVATAAGYGGITGYTKTTDYLRCYSNIEVADIVSIEEGKCINTYTSINKYYGSLHGRTSGTGGLNTFTNCYYPTGRKGQEDTTEKNVEALSISQMTNGTLLGKLNGAGGSWAANADGFPVPTAAPANTGSTSASVAKTRVSIIGDSISTFEGWMPAGYAKFYPIPENPTVISAAQTYWYKLIYNYMSNATLDMNIAWSGTLVTRCTNTAMSSQHWYGHSFVERFIDKGMGDPDVILLHGGTNDVSSRGNASNGQIRLHPSLPIYHDTGYSASAHPTDAQMEAIYALADAATTRAQVEALKDTSFAEAYVKLLCLMHQQYPNAKVVMIIGDWIPSGTLWVIQRIANHYASKWGYRCVNLQDISGFQTYDAIPKESGCHPNEAGFEVMANYIYQKVGSYIDPAN